MNLYPLNHFINLDVLTVDFLILLCPKLVFICIKSDGFFILIKEQI